MAECRNAESWPFSGMALGKRGQFRARSTSVISAGNGLMVAWDRVGRNAEVNGALSAKEPVQGDPFRPRNLELGKVRHRANGALCGMRLGRPTNRTLH